MYVYVLHTYMFNVYKKYYTHVKYQGDENMYNINTVYMHMWPTHCRSIKYIIILYIFLFFKKIIKYITNYQVGIIL